MVVSLLAAASIGSAGTPAPSTASYCWEPLTEEMGPGDAGDGLVPPSIAARSGEALWLAWPKQETVQVRRWNGRRWEDIPGPQGGRPGTYDPTVRVSSSGEAFLAWRAGETDQSDIHVARWDGAAWKPTS